MMTESGSKMPRWTLGRFLPCLMIILAAMEITLRLAPIDLFVDRPYGALGHFHTLDGPFEANGQYHNARSYGDLAALGNLPKRRLYHGVDFATDGFGFHNPASAADLRWAGILFGDSFAIGAEVPEDKTLSVQLSKLFSRPIYNAGGYLSLDVERVRQLSNHLNLHRGVFIYEFHEAHLKEPLPSNAPVQPSWRHRLALQMFDPEGLNRLRERLSSLLDLRLSLLAQKFERAVENDTLLPNSFASNVVEGRLWNGDWMLFLRSRIEPVGSPEAAIGRWTDFFCWASRELGSDGLELVVIIVPDEFTVYQPLLASPRIPAHGDVVLGQLERRLRESGIPVVNVTPVFRAAAAELAEHHEYIYWQDDTHWNECGVSIAAAEFREQIGLQRLPGFVGVESRPAGGSEMKALPFNCESQQTTPEIATVRSESSQQETFNNNLERRAPH
jgi:hypothetical protein